MSQQIRPGARLLALALIVLSGCQPIGLTTSVGPTRGKIYAAEGSKSLQGISIVEVDGNIAAQLNAAVKTLPFFKVPGDGIPAGSIVGVGDTLDITVWESPPATLFGTVTADSRLAPLTQTVRSGALPELLVSASGSINIPFAGDVPAAGRTLRQIERDIIARLRGQANAPQVIVRLLRNASSTVTVMGDVSRALRMPLTPKGERLLDAIAEAGGAKQAVDKMTVQLSRGPGVYRIALQDVLREPRNNIVLQPDDVVAILYQPFQFTVLGATGRNEEVPFEGTGIALSQALARSGGLQDGRGDPKGVFVFRWERPEGLTSLLTNAVRAPDGRVPVIYRINMADPASYFVAQNFPMRNGDVVYVASAPVAEFQRFVNILASTVLPIMTIDNAISGN